MRRSGNSSTASALSSFKSALLMGSNCSHRRLTRAARSFSRMTEPLTKWVAALLICSLCIALSYFWIDQPVAYFAHQELRGYRGIFDAASRLPKVLGPVVVACTLVLGIRAVMGRPLTQFQAPIALATFSLAVSDIFENWLKFAFGRTWPETWVQDNPSLIRDGVHNFNPFHGGAGFASFPSGHMVAICAIMSVFWICWPRLRSICAICVALVFVGQLGANYHFMSDLVAGGFLGFSVGLLVIALWNAGARPVGHRSIEKRP
jgi:membrane-associated phospholipid phosphatase